MADVGIAHELVDSGLLELADVGQPTVPLTVGVGMLGPGRVAPAADGSPLAVASIALRR